MPYRYAPEFRRRVLDLVAAGRSVASIAADLGVSDQTIYNRPDGLGRVSCVTGSEVAVRRRSARDRGDRRDPRGYPGEDQLIDP